MTTLRDIFQRHLDFNAVPHRSFLRYLRYFAKDELERDRLDEFLSEEGAVSASAFACCSFSESVQEELYEYCYKVRRTIREILSDFRGIQLPTDYIFDLFPPLRPRQFSIASSVKVSQEGYLAFI